MNSRSTTDPDLSDANSHFRSSVSARVKFAPGLTRAPVFFGSGPTEGTAGVGYAGVGGRPGGPGMLAGGAAYGPRGPSATFSGRTDGTLRSSGGGSAPPPPGGGVPIPGGEPMVAGTGLVAPWPGANEASVGVGRG